jgi:1,4-dihydroxy-2-naphthoate octaprenyltransferase
MRGPSLWPQSERLRGVLSFPLSFLRLGRPLHLLGGLVFHGLGLSAAAFAGAAIDGRIALWCQLLISTSQLMTHYANDYFDQDADAATTTPTRWASGSRVLPEGHLPGWVALIGAGAWGIAALASAFRLAGMAPSGPMTLALALTSIALAWGYSEPPFWLNRRGMGELSAALLIPGLTSLLAFQAQTGGLALLPALAAFPLCCLQFAMLLAVNFPDAAGDARVDKRTLVVILGPARASRLSLAALGLAYLPLPILWRLGLPPLVVLAVLCTLPIALAQARRIQRGAALRAELWDPLAFWSIGHLMGCALLETLAFIVSSPPAGS